MMPLAVLMNRKLSAVEVDKTLSDAAAVMEAEHVGALLVKRGTEFVGIVSETDIVRRAIAVGIHPESCLVEKVMSAPLITIDIEQSVADANEIMSANKIRHIVVTDRGEVAGIISVRDLVLYYKNRR
jgi:CBS domain-containing protein